LHGPRVNSRVSIVPDNHNKFAIAVTRARVDSPSFLLFIPPVVICLHQLAAQPAAIFEAKAMPCRQTAAKSSSYDAKILSTEDKLYALQMNFPCSF
jgi:hypothetical protein